MSAAAPDRTAPPILLPPRLGEFEARERALAELVDTLRAESHEYANKIHAISGLLALDMTDVAEGLLSDLAQEHVRGGAALLESINPPALVGLLVAKQSAGRRLGVEVQIDEESCLDELPAGLCETDAISVLGNFLDNAIDAVAPMPEPRRRIDVGIHQDERQTRFRVADRGPGLDPAVGDRVCERGCTSKADHQGLGLAIVASVLERADGDLQVAFGPDGTVFEATFHV